MYRMPRPARQLYYRGSQFADSGKTVRGLPSYTPCLAAALIYSAIPGNPFAMPYEESKRTRFRPTSTVIAATIDTEPSMVLGEALDYSLGNVLRKLHYGAPDGIQEDEIRRLFNYLHNRLSGEVPGGEFLYVILDEEGEPMEADEDSFSLFGSPIKDMRDDWYGGSLDADRLVADTFIFADAPAVQKVAKRLGYRTIVYLDVFAGGKTAARDLFDLADIEELDDCIEFAFDLEGDEQPCHLTVRPLPGTEVEVEWTRPSAELVSMFRSSENAPVSVSNPARAQRMMNPRNY